jgi:hypothetical protein
MSMIQGVWAFQASFGIRAIDLDSHTFESSKYKSRVKSTYKYTDIDKTQNYSLDCSSRSPENDEMSTFWREVTSPFILAGPTGSVTTAGFLLDCHFMLLRNDFPGRLFTFAGAICRARTGTIAPDSLA